jgi:hypothetical protein
MNLRRKKKSKKIKKGGAENLTKKIVV